MRDAVLVGAARSNDENFAVVGTVSRAIFWAMTKLGEIQEAIIGLSAKEQDLLRIWMDEAPLDLEQDSPELEAELLKAVRGPHSPLTRADLEAVAKKAIADHRARRSA